MKLQRVVTVEALDGKHLKIGFADGKVYQLDFAPMICDCTDALTIALKDLSFFGRVRVNGLTIEWPNGLDVCPDTLRRWCEVGRIPAEEACSDLLSIEGVAAQT